MAAYMKIVKMSEKATIPSKGTPTAAGFDLYSAKTITIWPKTREVVPTDLKIELPRNSYGQIAPRSGLALKGLDIGAGVIDQDYRGNLKILLINNGTTSYEVREGESSTTISETNTQSHNQDDGRTDGIYKRRQRIWIHWQINQLTKLIQS